VQGIDARARRRVDLATYSAREGLTVVSGLAAGVDTAAHGLADGRPVIPTDVVAGANAWARALPGRSGVFVVSRVDEFGPIVDRVGSQPGSTDEAPRALSAP